MSGSIRAAVDAGQLSLERAAQVANQLRNQIMNMQRARDFDLGQSLARDLKTRGVTLEESIARAMRKMGVEGESFAKLPGATQRAVFEDIIEAAGRARPVVTQAIPRLRFAARGLWLATLAIAAYNIGTAENPWWQSGREAAALTGGLGGSFAGGATMGAIGGIWAGPIGIAVGALVGGILGALLADHAYVEAAGTSDVVTRSFVGRFTSFWTGVDEAGMAAALVCEHRNNLIFVRRVFVSLNADYNTDADDVALEFVSMARRDPGLSAAIRADAPLRDTLVQVLTEGWTGSDERSAIEFLRGR
jgi:hypothetical protein